MKIIFLASAHKSKLLSPWIYFLPKALANGFLDAKIPAELISSGAGFWQRHFWCVMTLFKSKAYSNYLVTDDSVLTNPIMSILCKVFGGKHIILHHGIIVGKQLKYIRMYHSNNLFIAYFRRMAIYFSVIFADYVWATSEDTKFRARLVGKSEKKIFALNLPVPAMLPENKYQSEGRKFNEHNFQECAKWIETHPESYTLLDVNAFVDHKHPEHFLTALQHIKTPSTAIFVGPRKASYLFRKVKYLANKINESTKHKVFLLPHISPEALEWLRSQTTLGIQPSMVEGFGYAPLELARHSTTTVVMDININREILGDCVFYYNQKKAFSAKDFGNIIQYALNSSEKCSELGEKSRINVERFNLDQIIARAIDAFGLKPVGTKTSKGKQPEEQVKKQDQKIEQIAEKQQLKAS